MTDETKIKVAVLEEKLNTLRAEFREAIASVKVNTYIVGIAVVVVLSAIDSMKEKSSPGVIINNAPPPPPVEPAAATTAPEQNSATNPTSKTVVSSRLEQ